jgi:hypothetical protein
MRTHRLTTYLQAEQACSVIEVLDQLREVLLQAYAEDITALLRQTTRPPQPPCQQRDLFEEEDPF